MLECIVNIMYIFS